MNSFYSFVRDQTPAVFCPKVTPDPSESERLATKFRDANQRLRERFEQRSRRAQAPNHGSSVVGCEAGLAN